MTVPSDIPDEWAHDWMRAVDRSMDFIYEKPKWVVFDGDGEPQGYAKHKDAAEAYARDLDVQGCGPCRIERGPVPQKFRDYS